MKLLHSHLSALHRSECRGIDFCLRLSNNHGHLLNGKMLFSSKSCSAVIDLFVLLTQRWWGLDIADFIKYPKLLVPSRSSYPEKLVKKVCVVTTSTCLFTGMCALLWQKTCIAIATEKK